MKTTFSLLILCATLLNGWAQGTLEFTVNMTGTEETPPNSSPIIGTGWFLLTGNTFRFAVGASDGFIPLGGYIKGPATPSSVAPEIFEMDMKVSVFTIDTLNG